MERARARRGDTGMIVLDSSIHLPDVLAAWGLRELKKPQYGAIQIPLDQAGRAVLGVDTVLRHVPDLIARILLAEPLDPVESGALRVRLEPRDTPNVILYRGGISLADWPSDAHVEHLIKNPNPDPIVGTMQFGQDRQPMGPFVIFDGFHRAKAWLMSGFSRPLIAEIIKTKRPPVMSVKIGRRLIVDIEEDPR